MELSALERLKIPHGIILRKKVFPPFLVVFNLILLILSGKRNTHLSLDELEFWPYLTNDYRVTCP